VTQETLSVADVFCGAGGLSNGFTKAKASWDERTAFGYSVAFATDKDRLAMRTFRANHFPEIPLSNDDPRAYCGEVTSVDSDRILTAAHPLPRIDVLIGGPSCQGVSPAGLRNPGDGRNQMLLAFARLVRELQPLWFVMENVPGLAHANNRDLLADIFHLLGQKAGYRVAADVLLAADYGVPQFRYRLFMIGTRTESPIRFPEPLRDTPSRSSNDSMRWSTVRDAIFDLADISPVESDETTLLLHAADGLKNHWCRSITEINRMRIASVRTGCDWRDIPIELLPERYFMTRSSDQKGTYGRLSWDWPAYTMTNAALNISAGAFTHPDQDRCLSVREVARLQSFDDRYEFHGSLEAQYRQVGNAVPPALAKAVAETILHAHFNPEAAGVRGREGRLTEDVVAKCLRGEAAFPTLTPRRVQPAASRSRRNDPRKHLGFPKRVESPGVWGLEPRPSDRWPQETRRLRKLAEQPKYMRAAKRARAIVQFIDGIPLPEIVTEANVSETSVRKWVDGYFVDNLNGWRAFHSSLQHIAIDKPRIHALIARRIRRVRKVLLALPTETGRPASVTRLYMNSYLQSLISKFGEFSVDDLIAEVERELGSPIGTVYIGDLLAIADAVLPRPKAT